MKGILAKFPAQRNSEYFVGSGNQKSMDQGSCAGMQGAHACEGLGVPSPFTARSVNGETNALRIKAGKRSGLGLFRRGHLEGWRRSELNQRKYCEWHGLPLKRFGNARAKLKDAGEERTYKLLYRRGGGLKHMPEDMLIGKLSGVWQLRSRRASPLRGFPAPSKRSTLTIGNTQ